VDGWSSLADLMSVISFSFLLLLGVAILSASTLRLVANAQTLSVKIAQYELAQLEVARLVQEVLEQSRGALMDELMRADSSGSVVFRADDLGAGVKLDADILFDLADFELRNTDEVSVLIGTARTRLCAALEAFRSTYRVPPGAVGLGSPFDYLELSFEGHADRSVGRRLSNWALSSRRATSLLEAFVVPETASHLATDQLPCQPGTDGLPLLDGRVVRVVASGRGSMDAGACGTEDVCAEDRYALLRITVRMDRVFRDLDAAAAQPRVTDDGEGAHP
jgi:hypothetical protein